MAGNINPNQLGEAISRELGIYGKNVTEKVKSLTESAAKELVSRTKATAPIGPRGTFRKNIAQKKTKDTAFSSEHTWYVKPPEHRLTHLIVNGHQTVNGGRTKSNPFLQNALDEILPQYQHDVEEAIKNE